MTKNMLKVNELYFNFQLSALPMLVYVYLPLNKVTSPHPVKSDPRPATVDCLSRLPYKRHNTHHHISKMKLYYMKVYIEVRGLFVNIPQHSHIAYTDKWPV